MFHSIYNNNCSLKIICFEYLTPDDIEYLNP